MRCFFSLRQVTLVVAASCLLLTTTRTTTMVSAQSSASCNSGDVFEACQPNGKSKNSAIEMGDTALHLWFYAANQTLWFQYRVETTANIKWQLHTHRAGPFLETTVYRNDDRPTYLKYADRDTDTTLPSTLNQWTLGAQVAGTEFFFRVTSLEGSRNLYARPGVVTEALNAPPLPSKVCGENCQDLCQVWGGVNVARQAQGQPTFICNDRLDVPCQCYCQDGNVGDVAGSASCSDDDNDLEIGGLIGIIAGAFVLLVCLMAIFLFVVCSNNKNNKTQAQQHVHANRTNKNITMDDTELATERQEEEEEDHLHVKRAAAAGATRGDVEHGTLLPPAPQLWDSLLTMPNADLIYTKVLTLSDGQVLVKRKFKLHHVDSAHTSKRLKVLFPDEATAAYHGFVVNDDDNNIAPPWRSTARPHRLLEPTETTESESEAEQSPIREVPSILPPPPRMPEKPRFDREEDDEDDDEDDDDEDYANEQEEQEHLRPQGPREKLRKPKKPLSTQQVVSAIERRMAETSTSKKVVARTARPVRSAQQPVEPTSVAAEMVAGHAKNHHHSKKKRLSHARPSRKGPQPDEPEEEYFM